MQLFIVRESWNLRQFWIDKGELCRDWLERKVRWYKTGNKKKRSTLRVLPPAKKNPCNVICCKTGSNVGGKTRNIAIPLVLQQC